MVPLSNQIRKVILPTYSPFLPVLGWQPLGKNSPTPTVLENREWEWSIVMSILEREKIKVLKMPDSPADALVPLSNQIRKVLLPLSLFSSLGMAVTWKRQQMIKRA